RSTLRRLAARAGGAAPAGSGRQGGCADHGRVRPAQCPRRARRARPVARLPARTDARPRGRPVRPDDRRPDRALAQKARGQRRRSADHQVGAWRGLHPGRAGDVELSETAAGTSPSAAPSSRELAGHVDDVFRTLFIAYPDALVVADPAGKIVLANPSAAALLGYEVLELVGMKIDA